MLIQGNLDLKAEHTWRVCRVIRDIGESLCLSEKDLCIAEVTGLLHDIGRFEQYSRYGTFADHKSENHALLSVRIIQDSRILHGFEPDDARIILRSVECHNHASLPRGESERCLLFLKLLRDADKIDIWRVVTGYYREAENNRNRSLELDLPDADQISEPVYEALMEGRLVSMADLRTLQDFKLLQIGWIYDINFPRTFRIVREKKYLESIREALPPESTAITEIYERACTYLKRRIATVLSG